MGAVKQSSFSDFLPDVLIIEIMIRLVSSSSNSLIDLANVKATCKRLRAITDDELVLHHVNLELSINWLFWTTNPIFFRRCLKAGNAHANYIQGMEDYYSDCKRRITPAVGLEYLKEAAQADLTEAIYSLGIIYFTDASMREQGLELLKRVAVHTERSHSKRYRCREISRYIFSAVWKSSASSPGIESPPCKDRNCGMYISRKGWFTGEEETFCSDICMWSYEAQVLYGN